MISVYARINTLHSIAYGYVHIYTELGIYNWVCYCKVIMNTRDLTRFNGKNHSKSARAHAMKNCIYGMNLL